MNEILKGRKKVTINTRSPVIKTIHRYNHKEGLIGTECFVFIISSLPR